MTPQEWCERWGAELRQEIPVPGRATSATWKGCADGTLKWPGRNLPEVGAWLVRQYTIPGFTPAVVDPCVGVGGLHLRHRLPVEGADIEEDAIILAGENRPEDSWFWVDDGRTWAPRMVPLGDSILALFSPPFGRNHHGGANPKQVTTTALQSLHAFQGFGRARGNLGSVGEIEYWAGIAQLYQQVRTYAGTMIVILGNHVRDAQEVDDVGAHLDVMRWAGWKVQGAHPRDLRFPTIWNAVRGGPWVRWEWAVVAAS